MTKRIYKDAYTYIYTIVIDFVGWCHLSSVSAHELFLLLASIAMLMLMPMMMMMMKGMLWRQL